MSMIVITDKSGRLGNRLIVFAHFIGWGIEHGVAIANPAFDEYAQYFAGTANDPWCRYPVRPTASRNTAQSRHTNFRIVSKAQRILTRFKIRTPWLDWIDIGLWEPYDLSAEENTRVLRSRKLTLVRGWQFRDIASIEKHVRAIRSYFTPQPLHIKRIDELLAQVRATCDVLVGIHIRRGDYGHIIGGRYHYEPPVYLDIMAKVQQLFGDRKVGFLICSDEPVDSTVRSSSFNVHLGPNHFIEDMYSFARCDYLVGPPSTYTMWASYYGDVPLLPVTASSIQPTLADFTICKSPDLPFELVR
jgi:hypothetical protein